MIKSMTGFGSATGEFSGGEIHMEIKSVNGRYLGCKFRWPNLFSELENELTEKLRNCLGRGTITVSVSYLKSPNENTEKPVLNEQKLEEYLAIYEKIQGRTNTDFPPVTVDLMRLPEVISLETVDLAEDEMRKVAKKLFDEALLELVDMQNREGNTLYAVFQRSIQIVQTKIQTIQKMVQNRREKLFVEYCKKIESLVESKINEDRIITEAGILAEKLDISEELDRLGSHLGQFSGFLSSEEPVGKRLNFLLQEMNREVNTIGSKANDIDISHLVVEMKNGLEIIREQVQNVA